MDDALAPTRELQALTGCGGVIRKHRPVVAGRCFIPSHEEARLLHPAVLAFTLLVLDRLERVDGVLCTDLVQRLKPSSR